MATTNDPSHTPAALEKAAIGRAIGMKAKQQMAKQFDLPTHSFAKPNLLKTLKRHNIPLSAMPIEIFNAFKATERTRLLAQRATSGNGADHGTSIPLDAIPEKPKRSSGGSSYIRKADRGHPNAELIGKIVDVLARPETTDNVAERLLHALDKLLT